MPTFVADEIVTAAKLNAATARDWTTWVPTYNNITVGNGTVVARYQVLGTSTVRVYWHLLMGSGSAFGASGSELVSVPVAPASHYIAENNVVGQLVLIEAGLAPVSGFVRLSTGLTDFSLVQAVVVGAEVQHGAITATNPFTFGTGDIIQFQAEYEAA